MKATAAAWTDTCSMPFSGSPTYLKILKLNLCQCLICFKLCYLIRARLQALFPFHLVKLTHYSQIKMSLFELNLQVFQILITNFPFRIYGITSFVSSVHGTGSKVGKHLQYLNNLPIIMSYEEPSVP